jgi:Protein of unknown function (DUF2490)
MVPQRAARKGRPSSRRRTSKARHMAQARWIIRWVFLVSFAGVSIQAQDTQFLPEIDANLTVNSYFRTYLQAKDDREGGDPQQFTFGPSIEFYLKPLIRLKRVTVFDLDDAKKRPLVLESGYRIITAPNTPNENRALEAVTFHFPLFADILLTDRSRADLDWKNGAFTWRYRNRLTLERTFAIRSYHFIPYVAAEPFYESQYKKWSSTDLYVGSLFPLRKHTEFNLYYEYENDTGKRPNRQQYYVGLAAYFFFSLSKT